MSYTSKFKGSEIDAGIEAANAALPASGGTMTGALILHGNPSANLEAATKQYVDNAVNTVEITPGADGQDGANGTTFTPSVSSDGDLSWSNNGGLANPATVNIKGQKGDTGTSGADGEDGFSPTVSISSISGGHRVTITDANGAQSFDVMDGADGADGSGSGGSGTDGEDGFSPTVSISSISGGHRVTITDANGAQSFDVMDGADGSTPIRGTDYWTDADKAEIKSYVDDAILGGAW